MRIELRLGWAGKELEKERQMGRPTSSGPVAVIDQRVSGGGGKSTYVEAVEVVHNNKVYSRLTHTTNIFSQMFE